MSKLFELLSSKDMNNVLIALEIMQGLEKDDEEIIALIRELSKSEHRGRGIQISLFIAYFKAYILYHPSHYIEVVMRKGFVLTKEYPREKVYEEIIGLKELLRKRRQASTITTDKYSRYFDLTKGKIWTMESLEHDYVPFLACMKHISNLIKLQQETR